MSAVVPSPPASKQPLATMLCQGQPCEQRVAPMRERSSAITAVDAQACAGPYRDAGSPPAGPDRQIAQIDPAIETTRMKLADDQHMAPTGLVNEKAKPACAAAAAAEGAPIEYAAAVFGETDTGLRRDDAEASICSLALTAAGPRAAAASHKRYSGRARPMLTTISFAMLALIAWIAHSGNKKDRRFYNPGSDDNIRDVTLHIQQDLKLVAFLLAGILVMLGILGDMLSRH
jgi:hypothetical protein